MMGKPSKTRLSKSCDGSTTSIPKSKSKSSCGMNSSKSQKKKQAAHKKTRRSIMKLFEGMRNESCSSLGNDDSVVIVNSSPASKRSRSPIFACSNKRSKQDDSLIILDGNDSKAASNKSTLKAKKPVMQCSTPLAKKNSKTLPELLASNVSSVKSRTLQIQNLNEEIQDLTRDINGDSFITIDLTSETCNKSSFSRNNTTVIDLENVTEDNNDCTVVSVDNTSLSMSGDSDVTVLRRPFNKNIINSKKLTNVVNGISKLNPTEKSNMLEYILKQILNGCEVPENIKRTLQIKETKSCAIETVEDNYIKEVILGQSNSRNSIGSNIYNPETDAKNKCGLRMIVIDGSNVAMEHSKGREFSVKGLQICIDYFLKRGHVVKAFVPRFRCKWGKSTLPRLLDDLERRSLVVYTPSREIQGKMITSYDDRYIVQCAAEFDGVIVSGDNYRDLLQENRRWRFVIENRLLPFTWVGDMLMFPKDPLGRNGPTLEQFLRHSGVPMPKAT